MGNGEGKKTCFFPHHLDSTCFCFGPPCFLYHSIMTCNLMKSFESELLPTVWLTPCTWYSLYVKMSVSLFGTCSLALQWLRVPKAVDQLDNDFRSNPWQDTWVEHSFWKWLWTAELDYLISAWFPVKHLINLIYYGMLCTVCGIWKWTAFMEPDRATLFWLWNWILSKLVSYFTLSSRQ